MFKNYRGGKNFWEDGTITRRFGRVTYMLKGKKFEHKRHINQLRPRNIKDVTQEIDGEMLMEVLYDVFDIPVPLNP